MKTSIDNIPMSQPLKELYQSLLQKLTEAGQKENNLIARTEQCILIAEQVILQLKDYISAHPFKNEREEIDFFKFIKPSFYAYLIFYSNVYQMELRVPNGSIESQKEYFHSELLAIEIQFKRNVSFFEYYRSGAEYLDYLYFVRGNQGKDLQLHSWFIDADPAFSTGYDCKSAELLASDMLSEYLNRRLQGLETGNNAATGGVSVVQAPDDLYWTDTKAGLVELGYGLHAKGSFNNGRATLEQIFRGFQKSFHVELDNPPRTYQQILSRESGLTVFLQSLIDSFLQRFQTVDRKIKSRR